MPTYLSEHVYIGNGAQTDFIFNKGYLSRSHVVVKVSVDDGATFATKTDPADYEWIDSQTIRFAAAPAADAVIWLDRVTPRTIDQTYDNGTVFTDATQNYAYRQPMYILQETFDDLDRRPALNVEQDSIEQTLAQVMGNLALDGTNLVKSSFDLKATIGRNASGILTVALTKENEADAEIAIPGASTPVLTGGLRIVGYNSTFFGSEIFYDLAGSPTRPGITPDEYLDESEEWDGVFRYLPGTSATDMTIGHELSQSNPPGSFVREYKIRTGDGTYTNLHSATRIALTGSDWRLLFWIWVDSASGYIPLVYRKNATGSSYAPLWGTYTRDIADGSPKWEGVGNAFPETLEIEPV